VRRIASTLIVALALAVAGPAAAGSTIPAAELSERLERAEALAQAGVADPSTSRMTEVRRAVGWPVAVELGDTVVSLPPDPVLEQLEGEAARDFERAVTRLGALRDRVEAADAAGPVDRAELETALASAYRSAIQVRPGLVERIRRYVSELLQGLAYRLFSFTGPGTLIAWALLAGLGLVALWLLRRLRLVPERTAHPVAGSARSRPIGWRARAEEAIRAGDLSAAVHALYRSLLATLARRGFLVEAPGLTAGECRAAIRTSRPDLSTAVAQATASFERVAYGGVTPGADDVDLLRRADTLAGSA
jgi:hypothetical protein